MNLNYDDLMHIWKTYGCEDTTYPSNYINSFRTYYNQDYPGNKLGDNCNIASVKELCALVADNLAIDECFLHFLCAIPKENKIADTKKIFQHFHEKYPNFYDDVTQALAKKNYFNLYPEYLVRSWVWLTKKLDKKFPDQDIPSFLKETFFHNESTIKEQILSWSRFDKEQMQKAIDNVLKSSKGKYPFVIKYCEDVMEQKGLQYKKTILPLYRENEEKLFTYKIDFQTNGLMQKFNLSESQASQLLKFTIHYLDKFCYYNERNERNISNHMGSFKMTTPYENIRDDAKKSYHDALSVILSDDFVCDSNLVVLAKDSHNEKLAKELKESIPAILRQRLLHEKLSLKDTTGAKIKI